MLRRGGRPDLADVIAQRHHLSFSGAMNAVRSHRGIVANRAALVKIAAIG
jgi:hypothetical protein